MIVALSLGLALAASLGVPAAFFGWGPVPERRALLGFSYATVLAIAWAASLLLGFLSLGAVAAAIVSLVSLIALAAAYAWQDERLLARFERRIADPEARADAIEEIAARVEKLGREGRTTIALMELAGFPVRRLVAHGCHAEALRLLDRIEARVADRLGPVDRSETQLLRARVLLQLGEPDAAAAILAVERNERGRGVEASLLEGLLQVCGRDAAARERVEVPAPHALWTAWNAALARLVRAHAAAAAGDEDDAGRELVALRDAPYGAATLELARVCRGPATELAARIEHPAPPYR